MSRRRNDDIRSNGRLIIEETSSDIREGKEDRTTSIKTTTPNSIIEAAQNSQRKENMPERINDEIGSEERHINEETSNDIRRHLEEGRKKCATSIETTKPKSNLREAQNSQQKEGKSSETKNDIDNGQEIPATSKPKTSSSTSGKDNTQRDMREETSDRTSKILFEAKESLEKGPGKGKYKHRKRPWIPEITAIPPEIKATIIEIISVAQKVKDIWTNKDPFSSAGILPEDFRKMISTMTQFTKLILGSVPRYRLRHLGLDLLNVSLTKKLGQEWIAGGVTALKDFLKTSHSLDDRAIGACLGFVLTGMTTEPGIKWLIDGADAATCIAKLLPQMSPLVPILSFGKEILESMENKTGINRILSVTSAVLRRIPPTKLIGAAVDIFRTVVYDLPGKGFIDGALCMGECVLRNIDVVPVVTSACKVVGSLVCSGAKWVASWFGW